MRTEQVSWLEIRLQPGMGIGFGSGLRLVLERELRMRW